MHYLSHYNSYIKKEDSILVYNTKFGNVVKFDADDIENVSRCCKTHLSLALFLS